ncbi:MAG: aminotransferase class IV [bacterium]|nr:aminotransferase class IV [bacterium]
MEFKYFSHNGKLTPIEGAQVPLSNIEYAYGFGVYESIRVSNGVTYFLEDHMERLMESARIIGLTHTFSREIISEAIAELLEKNAVGTCNVKILIIGGRTSGDAQLNILCLNPLFPDKKMYRDGVQTITYKYDRAFPHAKTLNMLQSYLAFRTAKEAGAYDALLIDREGRITEGTRTNFFCIKGKTLFSPNEKDILLGVTRKVVLKVAAGNGFEVVQKDIRPIDFRDYDGAFLTSTSSKILPIRSVDEFQFGERPTALKELMRVFDEFLDTCGGKLE